ncbi:MAG: hypothetical protein ACJATI_001313, partial [Halioglobus sp.]
RELQILGLANTSASVENCKFSGKWLAKQTRNPV